MTIYRKSMRGSTQCIGVHVSAAGGVENAPARAKEMGAECFQFFSRSPRGGAAPEITDEQVAEFKQQCRAYGFESYIHTPYYINFASRKKRLSEAAPRIVREELERGNLLGVRYVVTHLGSAWDWKIPPNPPLSRGALRPARSAGLNTSPDKGRLGGVYKEAALMQTVLGLRKVFAGIQDFSARLLLEISAGSGSVIGDTFDELAYLLDKLGREDVHVCLDTCHLFASGYDVRSVEAWDANMRQFRKVLGMAQLKLVHANDSKIALGGHVDRHEHIGQGKIGGAGFRAMLAHKDLQKINFILETPHDRKIRDDVALLKKWRKEK